jgi:hypothetical protein
LTFGKFSIKVLDSQINTLDLWEAGSFLKEVFIDPVQVPEAVLRISLLQPFGLRPYPGFYDPDLENGPLKEPSSL